MEEGLGDLRILTHTIYQSYFYCAVPMHIIKTDITIMWLCGEPPYDLEDPNYFILKVPAAPPILQYPNAIAKIAQAKSCKFL